MILDLVGEQHICQGPFRAPTVDHIHSCRARDTNSRNQKRSLTQTHVSTSHNAPPKLNHQLITSKNDTPSSDPGIPTHPSLQAPNASQHTLHQRTTHSSSSWHHLEPLRHQLRDVLILVLQQPQRERDIIPLALGITPRQPRGQLIRQLLRVLVLFPLLSAHAPTTDPSPFNNGGEGWREKGGD